MNRNILPTLVSEGQVVAESSSCLTVIPGLQPGNSGSSVCLIFVSILRHIPPTLYRCNIWLASRPQRWIRALHDMSPTIHLQGNSDTTKQLALNRAIDLQ